MNIDSLKLIAAALLSGYGNETCKISQVSCRMLYFSMVLIRLLLSNPPKVYTNDLDESTAAANAHFGMCMFASYLKVFEDMEYNSQELSISSVS